MNRKRVMTRLTIGEMAQATIDLTNKEAWRHIETLLLQNSVTRQARVQMKTNVWDERARLRMARRAKA